MYQTKSNCEFISNLRIHSALGIGAELTDLSDTTYETIQAESEKKNLVSISPAGPFPISSCHRSFLLIGILSIRLSGNLNNNFNSGDPSGAPSIVMYRHRTELSQVSVFIFHPHTVADDIYL